MSNTDAYRRTMDLLIDEVWNKANLDILPEPIEAYKEEEVEV